MIPKYDEMMYPFLLAIRDGEEYALKDVRRQVQIYFQLSDETVENTRLKSGQKVFHDRVSWARTYLLKAGLIRAVRRGVVQMTEEGERILEDSSIRTLTNEDLMQYASFREFVGVEKEAVVKEEALPMAETPEEQIAESFDAYKEQVKTELLEYVKEQDPYFFEQLVVELIVAMGYGGTVDEAGRTLSRSHDEGIDGIIKEDVLGLDHIYLQAKRWEQVVHRPEVQKFSGSLDGQRARKGIFITTSSFSSGAEEYVRSIDKKIILIDGDQLTELMYRYGVGVSTVETIELKRIDFDFFHRE